MKLLSTSDKTRTTVATLAQPTIFESASDRVDRCHKL
jgi:hypothetical protein